jgi:hypothetical protein
MGLPLDGNSSTIASPDMVTVGHNRIPVRLSVWLMAAMLGQACAFAQASAGGVSGRVSDAGGGAVRDALVSIENQSTGEVRSQQTNDKGFYSFPNLAPGHYNALVSHAGFGNLTKKNLVVAVGEQLLVDFEIKIGGVESSVEVAALTSSTSTNVVSEQSIRDLPLNFFTGRVDHIFRVKRSTQSCLQISQWLIRTF